MTIDLSSVEAIDVHVHAEVGRAGEDGLRPEWRQAAAAYFGDHALPTVDDVAAYYRERKLAAVVFTVDAETVTGRRAVPNEEIAEAAAANPDVLIPFASVDPNKGARAVEEARRLIRDYGVKGFKFHPNVQAFYPNDRSVYPLYEVVAEAGLPALFHTGHSGIGAGTPGGRRDPAQVLEPDVRRRRRRRLPGAEDRARAPVVPVAGRGDLGRSPQAAGLHRSLGLVAEVLPAPARAATRTRSCATVCSSAPTIR